MWAIRAEVIKEHRATDNTQLSFKVGEIVYVLEQDETGWWGGHKEGSEHTAWFPGSAVRPLEVVEGHVCGPLEASPATSKKSQPTDAAFPGLSPKAAASPKGVALGSSPKVAAASTPKGAALGFSPKTAGMGLSPKEQEEVRKLLEQINDLQRRRRQSEVSHMERLEEERRRQAFFEDATRAERTSRMEAEHQLGLHAEDRTIHTEVAEMRREVERIKRACSSSRQREGPLHALSALAAEREELDPAQGACLAGLSAPDVRRDGRISAFSCGAAGTNSPAAGWEVRDEEERSTPRRELFPQSPGRSERPSVTSSSPALGHGGSGALYPRGRSWAQGLPPQPAMPRPPLGRAVSAAQVETLQSDNVRNRILEFEKRSNTPKPSPLVDSEKRSNTPRPRAGTPQRAYQASPKRVYDAVPATGDKAWLNSSPIRWRNTEQDEKENRTTAKWSLSGSSPGCWQRKDSPGPAQSPPSPRRGEVPVAARLRQFSAR